MIMHTAMAPPTSAVRVSFLDHVRISTVGVAVIILA